MEQLGDIRRSHESLQGKKKDPALGPWFYDDGSSSSTHQTDSNPNTGESQAETTTLGRSEKVKSGLEKIKEVEYIEGLWEKIEQILSSNLRKGLNRIYELHDSELQKEFEAYGVAEKLFLPPSGDNDEARRICEATEKDPNLQAAQAFNDILEELETSRIERDKKAIRRKISAILKDREKDEDFADTLEKIPSLIPSLIEKRTSQESASLPKTLEKLRGAFRDIRERLAKYRPEDTLGETALILDEHRSEIGSLGVATSRSKSEDEAVLNDPEEGGDLPTLEPTKKDVENLQSYKSQTHEKLLELSRKYEDLRDKVIKVYYEKCDQSKCFLVIMAENAEEANESLRLFNEVTSESEAKVSSQETINSMREEQKGYETEISASQNMEDIRLIRRQQVEIEKRGHLVAMSEINQAACALKDASEETMACSDAEDALAYLDEKDKYSSENPEQEKAKCEEGEGLLTPKQAEHGSLRDLKNLQSYKSQTHEKLLELSRKYEDLRDKVIKVYYENYYQNKNSIAENAEEDNESLRLFNEVTSESEAKVSSQETINSMREEQKRHEAEISAVLNEEKTFSQKMKTIRLIRIRQVEIETMGHLAAMSEINQAEHALKDALEAITAHSDAKDALAYLDEI